MKTKKSNPSVEVNLLRDSPNRLNKSWFGYIILLALFSFSVYAIHKADRSKPADWNTSQLTYLPSGKILKLMSLDLDEALADLVWINGMLYFSDAYLNQKSYRWMGQILDVVTLLNPRFKEVYGFGGTVMTKQKSEIPNTLRLLNRGIEQFPLDWRMRLFAATAQVTLDSNYLKAAEYLKPIILAPDVPAHIRTLFASFLNQGGGRRLALAFLVDQYVRFDDPINREIFLSKILNLYPVSSGDSSAGNSADGAKRHYAVEKILHQIILEPTAVMLGLGVIHELLSGNISPESQKLIDMLYR